MAKRILTKKQQLILILLYCFRFLNSKQIQEFLRHKDHRRINTWLKDLSEKEYIARDFNPIFGTLTKTSSLLSYSKRKRISSKKNNQRNNTWFTVCTGCVYPSDDPSLSYPTYFYSPG